jgi:hypothetical protein
MAKISISAFTAVSDEKNDGFVADLLPGNGELSGAMEYVKGCIQWLIPSGQES